MSNDPKERPAGKVWTLSGAVMKEFEQIPLEQQLQILLNQRNTLEFHGLADGLKTVWTIHIPAVIGTEAATHLPSQDAEYLRASNITLEAHEVIRPVTGWTWHTPLEITREQSELLLWFAGAGTTFTAQDALRPLLADLIRRLAAHPGDILIDQEKERRLSDEDRAKLVAIAADIEASGKGQIVPPLWTPTWLRRGEVAVLQVPEAFPQGTGLGFNNPPVHGAVLAINKGGFNAAEIIKGWQRSSTGGSWSFRMEHSTGGQILYSLERPDGNHLTPDEQLELIRSFDYLTLDVFMAVMCQLAAPANYEAARYPNPQPVTITADAILKYKDFSGRGQDRLLLERKIAERMDALQSLTLRITGYPGPGAEPGGWRKKGGKKVRNYVTQKSRLFHADPIEAGQETLFGDQIDRKIQARAWKVSPGNWAEYWWSAENGTVAWVSGISRSLLELPPNEKGAELAKKLSLAMFLIPGRALPFREPLVYPVEKILRDFTGLPEPAKRGNDWARRERERLEAALDILVRRGILDRVEWPDGYGPADQSRSKGWAKGWLEARVVLIAPKAPPPDPKQLAAATLKALPAAPPPKPKYSRARAKPRRNKERHSVDSRTARLIAAILQERKDAGLPIYDQTTLANQVGISRPHLSNAMRGNMHLGPEPYKRLMEWVKENKGLVQEDGNA